MSNFSIPGRDYGVTASIVAERKYKNNKQVLNEMAELNNVQQRKGSGFINHNLRKNGLLQEEARLYKIFREQCFLNSLAEMYIDSICLDESFIEPKRDALKRYFKIQLSENTDVSKLMEECRNKSSFLNHLVENSNKVAKQKAAKKAKENKDEFETQDELYSEEDTDDLLAIDKFDSAQVSSIVKDKVTRVIEAEEENNKNDIEMAKELSEKQALGECAVATIGSEEFTLFKSIMIKNYKEVINESIKSNSNVDGYSVLSENGEISEDMDIILAETICEYTRLELFNTLKMTNHSTLELKEMSSKIAYLGESVKM